MSLGLSFRSLVDNFHVGLNRSVNGAFCAGSIGSQLYAGIAIDGVTICF